MSSSEETEKRFEVAAEHVRRNTSLQLTNDQKLQLYAYFKQVGREVPVQHPNLAFFDFTGRAKWEAWRRLGDMPQLEAMRFYVVTVATVSPDWETMTSEPTSVGDQEEEQGGGGGGTGGPVVSKMANTEAGLSDDEKTIFDWCKEGREDKLQPIVTAENVNTQDEQGMALLHWASDRGNLEIVKLLIQRGANINMQDNDLQTPLHFASSCDQRGVVSFLLSSGADPSIRDCDGCVAGEVAGDQATRDLFT